jgi:NTP pyrophosphatase (non-canonical NTP hydrolase)
MVQLADFQEKIEAIYGVRDRKRGRDGTFRRLVEEIGELARALRDQDCYSLVEEFSDVLAWTVSLASLCGVDLAVAVSRYAGGCPKCHAAPCVCQPEPQ